MSAPPHFCLFPTQKNIQAAPIIQIQKMKIRVLLSISSLVIGCVFLMACGNSSVKKEPVAAGEESRPASFVSDDDFLDFIQKAHFNYMWEGAEPTSGLAPERIHTDGVYPQSDADVITTGGSGFGIAGLLVGIDRGFISREEGVERLHRIADYLAIDQLTIAPMIENYRTGLLWNLFMEAPEIREGLKKLGFTCEVKPVNE